MSEFESIGAQLPSNPGSYNDFLAQTGMEPGAEAVAAMSERIQKFKKDLIVARGLDNEEDLHRMSPSYIKPEKATPIGQIAVSEQNF